MKKIALLILAMLLLTACGQQNEVTQEAVYMNITAQEAKELMDTQEGYIILDTRTQEECDQGHIPGAILIPYDEVLEKAEGILTDKDQLIGMGMVLRPTPSQGGTKMEIGVAFANDSLPYSVYSEDEYYVKKSWRILPKDVLKWLKESNGYIRVVTPMYDNNLFDVRFRLKRE